MNTATQTKEERLSATIKLQARHDYLTHAVTYYTNKAKHTSDKVQKEHYKAQANKAQRELDALPCYID